MVETALGRHQVFSVWTLRIHYPQASVSVLTIVKLHCSLSVENLFIISVISPKDYLEEGFSTAGLLTFSG